MNNGLVSVIVGVSLLIILGLIGTLLFPWSSINWGQITLNPSSTITVTGTSSTKEANKIAQFSAGVNSVNDNKDTAISEVNQKITAIIASVKEFGVADSDIQTQNLSVYQQEESYYDSTDNRQKTRPGVWRVDNSASIKLRDASRASSLASLLTKTGATNVHGPNFSLDGDTQENTELIQEAVQNAQEKAQQIAESSTRKLGKIISITEGNTANPSYPIFFEGGGGGGGVEPGSTTIKKTATVTFELK